MRGYIGTAMSDRRQPLAYASPPARRPRDRPTSDWVVCTLAGVQVAVGVIAFAVAANEYAVGPVGPAVGYMRLAHVLRSPTFLGLTYVVGSAAVATAATSDVPTRRRLYAAYLYGWPTIIMVAVASMAVVREWPGQAAHRWVLIHNLSADPIPVSDLIRTPFTLAAASPAWWVAAAVALRRAVLRRTRPE